jgi:hypothetical protein
MTILNAAETIMSKRRAARSRAGVFASSAAAGVTSLSPAVPRGTCR